MLGVCNDAFPREPCFRKKALGHVLLSGMATWLGVASYLLLGSHTLWGLLWLTHHYSPMLTNYFTSINLWLSHSPTHQDERDSTFQSSINKLYHHIKDLSGSTTFTYSSITTIHTTLRSSYNRIMLLTKASYRCSLSRLPISHTLLTTLNMLTAITLLAITNQLCIMKDLRGSSDLFPRGLTTLSGATILASKSVSDPIPHELVGILLITVMIAALLQTIHITSKIHKPQPHMPRSLPNFLRYYCILCAHLWCGYTTIRRPTPYLHSHCLHSCRCMYPHSHALYYSPMYAIQKARMNHTKCMMTMGMKGGARTTEQVSSTLPPPLNQTTLPIPQLPGFLLTVADSTLPGAGQGLFTLKHIEVDDYLCTYDGSRLSREDLPRPLGPENDYIWSNSVGSIIIDAFHYLSCYGRYANDALYEYQCNAMIVMHNGKVKLRATRDILPNEEIFVHYGGGYWADRFHTLGDSSSVATLSTLQKSIIEAYSLILLANGKAIQRTDLLNTWSADTLPDLTQMTGPSLSPHTLALCHDTYGSYGTVSLSLSYGRTNTMSGKLITSLIHTLQTHQSRHHVTIMRDFLHKHEDVCKLYLWRKRNGDLYTACTPNGTCGYQFLHQMHNRSVRQQKNLPPDQFESLTSRNRIDEHRNFIQALIDKYSPLSSICNITRTAVSRLTHYLKWLSSSPRPKFLEEQHWLGSDALFRLSDSTENHYTYLAIDPASTITYISPEWLHCVHDSEFSEETPSLSISELDHIIRRNNFGFFENKHYQPLPTAPNLPIGS